MQTFLCFWVFYFKTNPYKNLYSFNSVSVDQAISDTAPQLNKIMHTFILYFFVHFVFKGLFSYI